MKHATLPIRTLLFCLVSFPVLYPQLHAQEATTPPWEDMLEQLSMQAEDEETDQTNEIEELTELMKEPVNLNGVSREQLEKLRFLSDIQIENILAYIYINGQMRTVYELSLIEEMDRKTIEHLLPFVYVSEVRDRGALPPVREILRYGKNEAVARVDIPLYERKGYKGDADADNTYLGHRMYHSLRYGFRYKDRLYAGLTAEKDAGEPLFALHNKRGYDFYSPYFLLRNTGNLKALAIGNYRLSFGQGLVVNNNFSLGKTTSAASLNMRNNTISKHSSTDEYNYFSGLAVSYRILKATVSAFYSHRRHDGIATDESITSIQKTGLHRTSREAERKSIFTLRMMGGNITYDVLSSLRVGVTGIYYYFDRPYLPQVREYSKYNLRGNYFHNLGVDYRFRWNRFTLTGEAATGKGRGVATLNSLGWSPASGYALTVVHRYYDHEYRSLYGRSFSEGGYVQNENGWYLAVEAAPVRHWKFFLSGDFFSFPWWKYGVDAPSQGMDLSAQATWSPGKKLTMYGRYRYKKKEKNFTGEDKVKSVLPYHHHRFRYQAKYAPCGDISLRVQLDYNRIHTQGQQSYRGYQVVKAIGYTPSGFPLRVEIQGSYFRTDDYSARVYAYEKGLLYTFYTPSYYGEGIRLAAHVRFDMHRNWMLIAKYGRTGYFDRDEIGSGQDVIEGKEKQDLQLQLRVKF